MLICLIGMDGTGKTTNALRLCKKLNEKNIKCNYFHGHSYTITKTSYVTKHIVNKFRHVLKLFPFLALIDHLITYMMKLKYLKKKSILICDRYFYDKLVKQIYFRICNKHIVDIYLRLIPKPDMIFLLDASADTVFVRKGEYSIKEYKKLRNIYLKIAKKIKPKPIIINTDDTLESTTKLIYHHVMNFIKIKKQLY